jgi:hypothetical protein
LIKVRRFVQALSLSSLTLRQVTPVDSSDSTVSPSADAQPADVQMAEPGGNNDMAKDEDIAMDAFQIRSPSNMDLDQQSVTTSRASPDVPPSSSSMITDTQNDCPNGTDPLTHPAKRARKHSDADEASMAHVSVMFFVRHCWRANIAFALASQVSHPTPSCRKRTPQWHVYAYSIVCAAYNYHLSAATIHPQQRPVPFHPGHLAYA